jgi:radical SAM superfamily enzyme YgiQ (UPF0313 family)
LILLIEPVSRNIGMYVPAYPLPLMEVASLTKSHFPDFEVEIIHIPMDYGLPLTPEGKEDLYRNLMKDILALKPTAIGISCTAISQAEEVINLCDSIKEVDPDIFIFLGGYFPTIYYEEIFSRTSSVDLIVVGEGEIPILKIIDLLKRGKNPIGEDIPNLAWKKQDKICLSKQRVRFDLNEKVPLNLGLLRHPRDYDILPYAFSRGCPYHCNFCMEQSIRPTRQEVPSALVRRDLTALTAESDAHTILVSDALFRSFDLFPFLRSLGMKVNFETRCDVLDPSIIPEIADVCGIIALGFESASYDTLKRMNKIRDRAHYERYLSNTVAIFKTAARCEIPVMVFMIAGYPGDREEDLQESLSFAKELSRHSESGGHVFKVGECHVYPKTKIYELASSLRDVVFDDDGVFGQNIVRQSSKDLDFETILLYTSEIFRLSNYTPKLQSTLMAMMPLFRLPALALGDRIIPDTCFNDGNREIFNVGGKSLSTFREIAPSLTEKYKDWKSKERSTRCLSI